MSEPINLNRRLSDAMPGTGVPTSSDVWNLLLEIRDRLDHVERLQAEHATAFPTNDLAKPDFDGHRRAHKTMIKDAALVEDYKTDMTKKVFGWLSIGAISIIGGSLVNSLMTYIRDHIK